jgi:hypothetical protein
MNSVAKFPADVEIPVDVPETAVLRAKVRAPAPSGGAGSA